MVDIYEFFNEYLFNKVKNDLSFVVDVNVVFQFDIEGVGSWILDLIGEGLVCEGIYDVFGCIIISDKGIWEKIFDNLSEVMKMFMFGKLKVSNIGLVTQLQKILG